MVYNSIEKKGNSKLIKDEEHQRFWVEKEIKKTTSNEF